MLDLGIAYSTIIGQKRPRLAGACNRAVRLRRRMQGHDVWLLIVRLLEYVHFSRRRPHTSADEPERRPGTASVAGQNDALTSSAY
jgi:hypothetical protein